LTSSSGGGARWQAQEASLRALTPYILVCAAAILPYLTTIDDYFVRDDFGVVQLLSQKPALYFPHWFVTSWMDRIWGYVPDEIRPFPAVSYQLTALGGAASPILHHALNIALHAANGVLVVLLARFAASLSLPAATFAGLAFVLLPVHTETVAWITGRVDSMPAFFYIGSFLCYVRWRAREPAGWHLYLASLGIFFLALFTKQNTITMLATLAGYDFLVLRRRLFPLVAAIRPYVPFAIMTIAYLYLRYLLFGEVARERALTARAIRDFRIIVNRHLRHVVTGEMDGSAALVAIVLAIVAAVIIVALWRRRQEGWVLLYFGPVWWIVGIAPILVAGYSSPRHVYLAAMGWAIVLATLVEMAWNASPDPTRRRIVAVAAALTIGFYLPSLYASIREWGITAEVSQKAVRDVRRTALASPPGTLVIVGAPVRSWEWAMPFTLRPPYARTDLRQRVFIVSPRALSCCTGQWFEETRAALRQWSSGSERDAAIALRWDPETGALARATSDDSPQLLTLTRSLLELGADDLDRNLTRMLDVLPVAVN
jgi:hypothetical protein